MREVFLYNGVSFFFFSYSQLTGVTINLMIGIDKAKEDNCPAFLEADANGVSLYQKLGFVTVGDIKVDLNPYGIPDVYVLKKMIANG